MRTERHEVGLQSRVDSVPIKYSQSHTANQIQPIKYSQSNTADILWKISVGSWLEHPIDPVVVWR